MKKINLACNGLYCHVSAAVRTYGSWRCVETATRKMMRNGGIRGFESERDGTTTWFISIASGSDCLAHFLPQMCHLIYILMQFASFCHPQNLQCGLISHVLRRHWLTERLPLEGVFQWVPEWAVWGKQFCDIFFSSLPPFFTELLIDGSRSFFSMKWLFIKGFYLSYIHEANLNDCSACVCACVRVCVCSMTLCLSWKFLTIWGHFQHMFNCFILKLQRQKHSCCIYSR